MKGENGGSGGGEAVEVGGRDVDRMEPVDDDRPCHAQRATHVPKVLNVCSAGHDSFHHLVPIGEEIVAVDVGLHDPTLLHICHEWLVQHGEPTDSLLVHRVVPDLERVAAVQYVTAP